MLNIDHPYILEPLINSFNDDKDIIKVTKISKKIHDFIFRNEKYKQIFNKERPLTDFKNNADPGLCFTIYTVAVVNNKTYIIIKPPKAKTYTWTNIIIKN